MLTADLVRARRRGSELTVTPLSAQARQRAEELAADFVALAQSHVGMARDELDEACAAVEARPTEQRLRDGILKLILDRCEWEAAPELDPTELRRDVFLAAAARRREAAPGETFDRDAIVAQAATARGVTATEVERALYADLKGAHVLSSFAPISPAALVAGYDRAQAQAVLLRAERVVAWVRCRAAGAVRALFRRLKFLRLLYRIVADEAGGYRVEIDGPFSLFESVTKYGLRLAMVLPVLEACDAWRLAADVRWGKARERLTFRLEGARADDSEPARLPDEVAALVDAFRALGTPWRVEESATILELPGVGLCVPDLAFVHEGTGETVFFEVLGYWSREAVWRRVELVERGLPFRILFAVSEKLRVSEAALPPERPGALFVYKHVLSARAVAERLDRMLTAS